MTIEIETKDRRRLVSYFAGIVFGIAWFVFINGILVNNTSDNGKPLTGTAGLVYLPGLIACIFIFMANTVEPEDLGNEHAVAMKIWIFFGVMFGMASIIIAAWLIAAEFSDKTYTNSAGVGTIVQTVLLLVSAIIFWLGRNMGEGSSLYGV